MSTSHTFFITQDNTGSNVVGRMKRYATYNDMISDVYPAGYAMVIDASGDTNLVSTPSAPVYYQRINGAWQLFQSPVNIDAVEYTPLEICHEKLFTNVSGNVEIGIENKYDTYVVKPNGSVTLSFNFDNSSVTTGCRFYLVIDLTDSIQSISIPGSFIWLGNNLPNMSTKGRYFVNVTYFAHGDGCYFAEYLGNIPVTA